jgi:hypothetical protein
MSKKNNHSTTPVVEEEQVVVEEETTMTEPDTVEEETVEEPVVAEPEATEGVVVNCTKLNVREHPSTDAKVLCVLPVSTELVVFMDEKYDGWYSVCTDNQTLGYCMKQYISIKA